jgi:hypothetical protein
LNLLTRRADAKKIQQKEELPNTFTMLDDLREKIVSAVIVAIKRLVNGKVIKDVAEYFEKSIAKQDAIEEEYRQRVLLTKDEVAALHMFHSPYRIPAGYTDEEVKLCIKLYPLRKEQISLFPGFYPRTLHSSLFENIDEKISRTEGLKNAIFHMHMDIIMYQPPPSQS